MKKLSLGAKICVLAVLFTMLVLPISAEDNIFLGFYPELNGHGPKNIAVGSGFMIGYDFQTGIGPMGAGVRFTYADSLSTTKTLLIDGFYRYYFSDAILNGMLNGLFGQAEIGFGFGFSANETKPLFSMGLTAGWRFFPGSGNLYIEPSIRPGIFYAGKGGAGWNWGLNVVVGYKFPGKFSFKSEPAAAVPTTAAPVTPATPDPVPPAVTPDPVAAVTPVTPVTPDPPVTPAPAATTPEAVLTELGIPYVTEGNNLRLQIPPYYFAPNVARTTGLSSETISNNNNSLRRVAEMINRLGSYNVIVEGHANPTLTGAQAAAEEPTLANLSLQRANWVVDQLASYGVDRSRLRAVGAGGSRTVASSGSDDAWKNRRAEFILVK